MPFGSAICHIPLDSDKDTPSTGHSMHQYCRIYHIARRRLRASEEMISQALFLH